MTFREAKKLHNEDEVFVKAKGPVAYIVVSTNVIGKNIFVTCDDGNEYHHTEIK